MYTLGTPFVPMLRRVSYAPRRPNKYAYEFKNICCITIQFSLGKLESMYLINSKKGLISTLSVNIQILLMFYKNAKEEP